MNWNASHTKLEEVLTDLGIEVEDSQKTLADFNDVVVDLSQTAKFILMLINSNCVKST